jgi:uncharacterized protein YndB with AHSA1/START domain
LLEKAGLIRREVHWRTHVCRLEPGPLASAHEWLASGKMEMKVGASFELVWRNDELTDPPGQRPPGFSKEHRMESRITELDPPRKLAFAWGNTGGVSFELEPQGTDVLLTLIHSRVTETATLQNVSTGWHAHLDILVARVRGVDPEPIWDSFARLMQDYEKRLHA